MFRLRKRDWIILTAVIVAGAVGYGIYSKWTEEGLRRTEADMKSNLPLRVDQNTTLVDVKYDRTHSTYWYVIDKADNILSQIDDFLAMAAPPVVPASALSDRTTTTGDTQLQ